MKTDSDRDSEPERPSRLRHWKRIHHSKLFWLGVVLALVAITIYVLSEDLSWRPRIA